MLPQSPDLNGRPRYRRGLLAVALGIAAFVCWCGYFIYPYLGGPLFSANDLLNHVRLVENAREALAGGQILLRFSNSGGLMLQPVFLYYTPVLYSVAGGIEWGFGISAYDALLIAVGLFTGIAFVGTWRLLRLLGCENLVAGVGSCAYITAPYFLTDIFARGAMTEVAFFCLLPVVFHATLSQAQGEGMGSFLYFVGALALILITHKIFAAWLLILLVGVHFGVAGVNPRKNVIFGLGVAAALAVSAPYWFNAWLNVGNLAFAGHSPVGYIKMIGRFHHVALDGEPSVMGIRWSVLTADFSIFYLLPYTSPLSTTPNLHLQIGSMVSVALVLSLLYSREDRWLWMPAALTIMGILVVCSFWYLFPFWRYLPGFLQVIQFPYRLLGFVALAGCVLAALLAEDLARRARYIPLALLIFGLVFQWFAFRERPLLTQVNSSAVESTDRTDIFFWEPNAAPAPPSPVLVPKFRSMTMLASNRLRFILAEPLAHDALVKFPVVPSQYLRVFAGGRQSRLFQDERNLVVACRKGEKAFFVERIDPVGFGLSFLLGAGLAAAAYFVSRSAARSAP